METALVDMLVAAFSMSLMAARYPDITFPFSRKQYFRPAPLYSLKISRDQDPVEVKQALNPFLQSNN